MAKARRAQPRPARVVVPIIVIVVVLAVVGIVWRMGTQSTATPELTSASSSPGPVDGSPSAGSTATDGADTPSGTSSAATPATTSAAASAALKSCRAKVDDGDDVIAAASTGVGHWSEHVQAQTDQYDGKISAAAMQTIFARTRLAGPDDVSAYDDATKKWDAADGTCATRDDASTADNTQLSFCGQRLTAMEPVMAAGRDGMNDWKSHLSDMRHSRMVHVANAEQIWIDAWKAAPPHIKTFDAAAKSYQDAPDC